MSVLSGPVASETERRNDPSVRWISAGALVGMIAVFASVVGWFALSLREETREQLMMRDAHVLKLVLQHRIEQAEQTHLVFDFEVLSDMQLWEVVLDTAAAEGVLAAQLFGPDGLLLQTTSQALLLRELPPAARAAAEQDSAYAAFEEETPLSTLVRLDFREDRGLAVVDLFVPLRSETGQWMGTSRFVMDGSLLAREFAVLDQRLFKQAAAAMGSGGLLIAGLFGIAWHRLNRAGKELREQAGRLRQSNAQLGLLARTSAVGSVAAHLIHGLKNPLAGLRQVVGGPGAERPVLDEEDWRSAREAANRMQGLVQEVVTLLQDVERGDDGCLLTLEDLRGEMVRRSGEDAASRGVSLTVAVEGEGSLEDRRASILLLILSNLVQNAIDATPPGGSVQACFRADGERLVVAVADDGPGIDAATRETLFAPTQSRKEGGAGIGLAISMQLARHVGASLRCLEPTGCGAVFEVRMPWTQDN